MKLKEKLQQLDGGYYLDERRPEPHPVRLMSLREIKAEMDLKEQERERKKKAGAA